MDHGELFLGVWFEQFFATCIDADECVQELKGVSREVHHVMVKDFRTGVYFWRWLGLFHLTGGVPRPLGSWLDGHCHWIIFLEGSSRPPDEVPSVLVEWGDKFEDLVPLHGVLHHLVPVRIEVIGPDKNLLLSSGDCKWPNASHHIAYHLAWLE